MKHLSFFIIAVSFLLINCKSEPKVKPVTYPPLWAQYDVPAFTDGIIVSDKNTGGPVKSDYQIILETTASFDELYTWYKQSFAEKGWKLVKDNRTEIGDISEMILLVHSKGKLKHNVLINTSFDEKRRVKTTFTYIE
jgi:hypothetical protein